MPPLTIQDYNPHGLALMLVYKHGSTHAGLGGYAWPELSWLGLVASDVLEPLPRSLFSGSRTDAERTLPTMWKARPECQPACSVSHIWRGVLEGEF